MSYPLLPLTNDAVFKVYFVRNEPLLRAFLQAALDLPDEDIKAIEIKNPYISKADVEQKDIIVDIYIKTACGDLIIVEIQVRNHAGFIERIVTGNARTLVSQLLVGQEYRSLKAAHSLVVTDFNFLEKRPHLYEHICLRLADGVEFSNLMQLHILDLTKIPAKSSNPRVKWAMLFNIKNIEELKIFMKKYPDMTEAANILMSLSQDKDVRELAEIRQYHRWAYQFSLDQEKAEGRAEGKAEGKAEERHNSIKVLIELAKELSCTYSETKDKLLAKYPVSEDEAEGFLNHYY